MVKKFRGITEQQEFKTSDAVRDLRPFWMQVRDLIKGRWGGIVFITIFAVLMLVTPSFADILFLLVLFVF